MALWRILVLGVLKQGLGCDFDRVQELANQHRTVRRVSGSWRVGAGGGLPTANDHGQCASVDTGAAVGGGASRGGEWASGGGKKAWRAIARAL